MGINVLHQNSLGRVRIKRTGNLRSRDCSRFTGQTHSFRLRANRARARAHHYTRVTHVDVRKVFDTINIDGARDGRNHFSAYDSLLFLISQRSDITFIILVTNFSAVNQLYIRKL